MASWIIHLRIAEKIYKQTYIPSVTEFVLGNIAPDSGLPNEDWSAYVPDKAVSHFYRTDETGKSHIDEQLYIDRHFSDSQRLGYNKQEYSFHFGYLTHLLTDKLWARDIGEPAKTSFAALYKSDCAGFYRMIKGDWYDLDFMFLKTNPDFEAFRIYADSDDISNAYLDFFAEDAFSRRREFIVDFYRNGAANVEYRDTYISPEQLGHFVDTTADEIIKMCSKYIEEMKAFASGAENGN